jgi:hypothetical protein
VLFVIDDGPSMAEEQPLLARELPKMLRAMTEGALLGNGETFESIGSLHLAVVASDLGLGTSASANCSVVGRDGVFQRSETCGSDDSPFVWNFTGYHDPEQTIAAVSCNARLGSDGCTFSQPLETILKALLPADSSDAGQLGIEGHGTTDNSGFLRESSLLQIIIVTDKDDCSIADPTQLAAGDGEHCPESAGLFALKRYVAALQAIRARDLTQVAIIAGLPADLELDHIDSSFASEGAARDSYYDHVLADPRLQSDGASCEGVDAHAYPPRRLVQFAKQFGRDASVISICREDWTRVLFRTLQRIQVQVAASCLPDGWMVEDEHTLCRMTWELPLAAEPEQPLTPARCSDRADLLSTPSREFPRVSERGRTLCEVRRAPVARGSDGGTDRDGDGFYFTSSGSCFGVAFTEHAQPPHGVNARLSCSRSECDDSQSR